MFERVIVPVDGSDFSWRALSPARALAMQCDATLEVYQVVVLPEDRPLAEQHMGDHLARVGLADAGVEITVAVMGDSIASTIGAHVERTSGSVVVMSSIGRGRTAALIGSIAEELLAELFGPVVIVGPDAETEMTDFRGDLVVPVDGSDTSESALGLAAAWGITLDARPWVVSVLEAGAGTGGSPLESAYPARVAKTLSAQTTRPVEFEVLHGNRPDRAICDFARNLPASLIVASTHGRTGFARIAAGSVAMGIVRHAHCPVVLNRPPSLP